MISALFCVAAVAVSDAAQAQMPGPFDGVYVGVSAEHIGQMGRRGRGCLDFARPARLTIRNSHAQTQWGEHVLEGEVTPQGALALRTGYGQNLTGQIDGNFVVRGRISAACYYDLVWQRRRR
jgi:hypothetical protein